MDDDELTPGLADTPPPETSSQPEPQAPESVPDYVEIKNRDDVWEIEKEPFQKVADALGMDVDRLRTALSIGVDGNRAYERLNEERSELDQIRQELLQRTREMARIQPQQEYQPRPEPTRPSMRPPPNDVTGNVLWVADQLEKLGPVLGRLPAIEQSLAENRAQYDADLEQRYFAEERAYALQGYQDAENAWKNAGYGEFPSRQKLEAFLRKMPFSDDIQATWPEVWQNAAWAMEGTNVARRMKRQQVIDSQKPGARITVPGSRMPAGSSPSSSIAASNGNMTDKEMQEVEAALGAMTLKDIVVGPGGR